MPLKSMTGFGRADAAGTAGPIDGGWHWEIRSVNGRGLEPRLRLPPGYEPLETGVRDIIQRRLSRGSLSIALVIDREVANGGLTLNEEALTRVVAAARRARDLVSAAADAREVVDLRPLTLEQILSVRGVLESNDSGRAREPDGEQQKLLLAVLAIAVDRLVASRIEEGGRLGIILNQAVTRISELTEAIAALPQRRPEAIRQRLAEQLERLFQSQSRLDEQRLHQEAMLVATRIDVEEETARLRSHVAAASKLLASDEPVGRKLDFLAQEFNREANTICSKSADVETTRLGLELKAVIDQMREQVQNIE